jgi:hypothetical protein
MSVATRNSIRFQRAVFTSIASKSVRGYHLVMRSPGIDDDIAQVLCQWSPTHEGLADPGFTANSLNYFPIDDRRFAISKSVIGGSEYSGRSALQTVTTILVGEFNDFSVFRYHPLILAKVALSMGWLRLIANYDKPLDVVEIPALRFPEGEYPAESLTLAGRVARALITDQRVAIHGSLSPLGTLARIYDTLPLEVRRKISFSTGIKASTFRPFHIQLFSNIDNRLYEFLNRQRIIVVAGSESE